MTKTEGESKAKKHKTLFREVSAKTGENVTEMFAIIGSKLSQSEIQYIDQDINLEDLNSNTDVTTCPCLLL